MTPALQRVALIGFGAVGRAFARLLLRKHEEIRHRYDLDIRITGIITARRGAAWDPEGLDLVAALEAVERGGDLSALSRSPAPRETLAFIERCPADVVVEITVLDPRTGQPATDHVRAALRSGRHVVTANKGPLAFAYRELRELARSRGRAFLFESTVMDGAPLFSLVREGLPATHILGFRAILNSTTNFILTRMEEGIPFEEAVRQAQAIGIAEADPSNDIDGWDAAVKTCVLANVWMEADLRPDQVERTGIRGIRPEDLKAAREEGRRIKLVCAVERGENGAVRARVAPEAVPLEDLLAHVRGTSSVITLRTDTLKQLTLIEHEPEPAQTAFGILADLINVARGHWG
ncbi:homoserine dehydrogenase [Thermoflexus sp.]|uniref:homoserine dehydrogenase n=1 Tax=Thermoflexus sp. TaxID=1969742 RepID=UPI0017577968|nr:homoserine dehydrogenase [Thermoflexus sp.]